MLVEFIILPYIYYHLKTIINHRILLKSLVSNSQIHQIQFFGLNKNIYAKYLNITSIKLCHKVTNNLFICSNDDARGIIKLSKNYDCLTCEIYNHVILLLPNPT
ncbi:unnamed protein product [Rhizophagus irregularis]|nr:unnamed protein product [Rhizophagus irregularis]